MLDNIKMWIVSIMIGAFIINIVEMILPESKLKPYINVVLKFVFVFIVITPIIDVFSKDMSMEDRILKSIDQYNREYVDSSNKLSSKTGNHSLSRGYEEGLKEVLALKLSDYGYELEDIDLKGSDISNIKIKEKNSNNSNETDIQSRESEKAKQVFKSKGSSNEQNEEKEKLKDDLVKILDVSVENIEINK